MSTAAIGSQAAHKDGSAPALTGVLFATAMAVPLAFLLSWPQVTSVWRTGTFFDTDDAMRMVQVRDWLGGQGWFDLSNHRLDPSSPVLMHWSRVVDVPLAVLIETFGMFTAPEMAERLARLVFPLALQAGMLAATAWVARLLAGPRACLPAAFLLVLSGMTYGQFQPGRIDHHAPQILLLMGMTGTTLLSLDPRSVRAAAATGALAVLSLAISLENLPFLAVVLAVPPLAWATRGAAFRTAMLYLALGIGVAGPPLYLATVAPARYGAVVCDAFSLPHLCGLLAGAAGLALLAGSSRLSDHRPRLRWTMLVVVGAALAAGLATAFPSCLASPYGDLDPLIRHLWLSNVTEAQPLLVATMLRPETLNVLIVPALAGAMAIVFAWQRAQGLARTRWLVTACLVAIGFAGTCWQVRVASSVQPLTVLGGAWAVARCADLAQGRSPVWTALPLAILLAFSPLAWALAPLGEMSERTRAELAGGAACRQAQALAPLAGLPPGLAFAPIDAGSHLLAHTPLSVLGAPYHRNGRGNLAVLHGFLSNPDDARRIVKESHARYVALCPGSVQTQVMARTAPAGLAAALVAGRSPDWLTPIPVGNSPYRVYAVR